MTLFTLPLLFIGWDESLCATGKLGRGTGLLETAPVGNPLGPTVNISACLLSRPWLLSLASPQGKKKKKKEKKNQKEKKTEADSPQLTPESVIPSSQASFGARVSLLCG